MAVTVTVTETQGNNVTITDNKIVVTTNTVATTSASNILFTPISGLNAINLQDAIHEIADQKFVQADAPIATDPHLDEGDLWYDTTNNRLKVYRKTASNNMLWEDLVISAQLSEGSAATEYADITLNGGYF